LPKEVKEISKYFIPTKSATNIKAKVTSYAQVTKPIGNIKEVLKIKKAFLLLKARSINNIQKIINRNNTSKSKPSIPQNLSLVSI